MSGAVDRPDDGLPRAPRRRASLLQTAKAVAWSFFGVRKASDYEQDVANVNPVHVVIAGVAGALLFVAVLIGVVSWVVGSGVAA